MHSARGLASVKHSEGSGLEECFFERAFFAAKGYWKEEAGQGQMDSTFPASLPPSAQHACFESRA